MCAPLQPGDKLDVSINGTVSISSEMCAPLQQNGMPSSTEALKGFNLKRDVRPPATGGCLAPLVERVRSLVCEAQGFLLFVWAASDGSSLLYTISLSFARAWEATLGHSLGFARQRAWDVHHFVPRKHLDTLEEVDAILFWPITSTKYLDLWVTGPA